MSAIDYAHAVLVLNANCRLRKSTGDEKWWAPLDRQEYNLVGMILHSCRTPFGKCSSTLWNSLD